MSAVVTLTGRIGDVLSRVPLTWFDETTLHRVIAAQLGVPTGVPMRLVAQLILLGLVERRGAGSIGAATEIRRVRR